MLDEEETDTTNLIRQQARGLLQDAEEDPSGDSRITVEDLATPTVTPKSLLERSKTAVSNINGG